MSEVISIKDVKVVRGTAPDEENGGTIANGMIVGPTIAINKWQIKNEKNLFDSRSEAETEVKRRMFNEEIYLALRMHTREQSPREVVQAIRMNGKALKKILTSKKYANVLN
jgi:hypothetical protein